MTARTSALSAGVRPFLLWGAVLLFFLSPLACGRPSAAEKHARRGLAHLEKGDYDRAIAEYTRAIELDPNLAKAYGQRGLAKLKTRDYDGAIEDCSAALRIKPTLLGARLNRGVAKFDTGDYEGAAQDFTAALRTNPESSKAHYNRGNARLGKDDLEGAIEDYSAALRIKPKLAEAYSNRGYAKARKGDHDGAIQDYSAALRIKEFVIAYRGRASAKFRKHDYDGAIEDYTAALRTGESAAGYKQRGDAKRNKGDNDGAIQDYTAALGVDPKYAEAYSNRASVKVGQRDYDGAIQDYTAALGINPKSAHCHQMRAWVCYRRGMWSEVVADLQRACELDSSWQDYPRAFIWLARARASPEEATRELKGYLQTRKRSDTEEWPLKVVSFLAGDTTEEDLLAATKTKDEKTTRERKCEAYFYAGVRRLLADDLATARDYLRRCLATGCEDFIEYGAAEGELERLRARSRRQTEPTRYRIEVLYTIHKNVRTPEAYQRIQDLFGKTWPGLDLSKLEPRIRDLKDYSGIYRDRLLRREGHSWNDMKATSAPTDDASRAALLERAFSIVKDQATRELKVRGMYQWFRDQAGKDGSKSLRELFDKLKKHDDADNPVLATEPGQGLIVYRDFGGEPLTGEDLQNIEDSGIKFTHNFAIRVKRLADNDLPKVARRADVLGASGHGRQIVRLLAIIEDGETEKAPYVRVVRKQLATYYEAAGVWKTRHKRWPDSLAAMGRISEIRHDPWGNPFVLEKEGETIRVVSWGPDGKQGTDDDIRHGAKEAVPALVAALKAKDAWTRGRAVRALATDVAAAKETVPELTVALQDEDKQVRAWAAYALSQVGPAATEAVSALGVALQDEDKGVRVNAASALAKIGPAAQEAVPALCAALKDEDQGVRGWAVVALAEIGPAAKEAVPALIAALKDEDGQVRERAAYALSRVRPPAREALPELAVALKDQVRYVTRLGVMQGNPGGAQFSCDGRRVVFLATQDGNRDIYAMNVDGTGLKRLTRHPAKDASAVLSRDGSKIAWLSKRNRGRAQIHVMNSDGTNQKRLTNISWDYAPFWSPDGSKIGFTSFRDGDFEIYVMNADGTDPVRLTHSRGRDFGEGWSPDGSKILFVSNRDSGATRHGGKYEIYVMNADGTNPKRLTAHPARDLGAVWSPDGKRIAFVSDRDGNKEIYVMNADGTNPKRLTSHPAADWRAVWSPDGKRIAFVSDRDGNKDIYVMNADGTEQVNLTSSPADDDYPSWLAGQ
jgi:TolB protein